MECRICLESENQEGMISPCGCSGTSKWVHRKCIEKWIHECENIEARKKCMECHQTYQFKYPIDTNLIENFTSLAKNFKCYSSIVIAILIIFIVIMLSVDHVESSTYYVGEYEEINIIYLQIIYAVWVVCTVSIEIYALYCVHLDLAISNYFNKYLAGRFMLLAVLFPILYFIICYWHFLFGLIPMYLFPYYYMNSILSVAKQQQPPPILLDLADAVSVINPLMLNLA